jgi:hypothetical protein
VYDAYSLMADLIVQLLSERSTAELEGMRERLRADLNRTTVELEQVEAAIRLQNRPARNSQRSGARRGKASTRQRVLAVVGASDMPIGPAAIKRAMEAEGGFVPSGGSLYSTVKRMTEQGQLRKVADGEYTLPARAASANGHGGPFTDNETGAMDSTTAA